MKTDARVRYTKMIIKKSFISLLKERPINKITVKAICEMSEINRATFYKYYNDPFDLMEKIEEDLFNLKKKFIKDLQSVISAKKIIKLKKAEEDFNRELLKQMREKHKN